MGSIFFLLRKLHPGDEIMEDMPEGDLLPKNVMKVPEVYLLYCRSSYREGEEEEMEKGRKREGGEERRGGRGKGERRGGGGTYAVCLSVFAVM